MWPHATCRWIPRTACCAPGRIKALLNSGGAGLGARGFELLRIQTPFVAHYAGLALARRLWAPVDRPVLVHVGRESKKIEFLLQVLARLVREIQNCCWWWPARARRGPP